MSGHRTLHPWAGPLKRESSSQAATGSGVADGELFRAAVLVVVAAGCCLDRAAAPLEAHAEQGLGAAAGVAGGALVGLIALHSRRRWWGGLWLGTWG